MKTNTPNEIRDTSSRRVKLNRITIISCLGAALLAIPLRAQSTWQQLGPGAGGQIVMLEGDPSNANHLYIGSDVAGLWRSTNALATDPTYSYLTKQDNLRYCQDVDFDPTSSGSTRGIFIACHDGIYYSNDNGSNFARFGLGLTDQYVGAVSVNRTSSGQWKIYAGIGYTRTGGNGTGRIWRYSGTSGSTGFWTAKTFTTNTTAVVYSIVTNPANTQQLWVSSSAGVFYSSDSGNNWTNRSGGIPGARARALTVNPSDFNSAYVAVAAAGTSAGGVYWYNKNTSQWVDRSGSLPRFDTTGNGLTYQAIVADPAASAWGDRLYVGSDKVGYSFYATGNGNSASPTWTTRQTAANITYGWASGNKVAANAHSLAIAGGRVWIGKNGNFFRGNSTFGSDSTWQLEQEHSSKNASGEWSNRGMVNTVLRAVTVNPGDSTDIIMSVADRGIWRSHDSGTNWKQLGLKIDGKNVQDAFFVKFNPGNTAQIFIGAALGFGESGGTGALFRSTDSGASWAIVAGGSSNLGGITGGDHEPWDLDYSVNGDRLWLGTKAPATAVDSNGNYIMGVYQSTDGGNNWSRISPGNQQIAVRRLVAHPGNNNRFLIGTRVYSSGKGIWQAEYVSGNWTFTQTLSGEDGTGFAHYEFNKSYIVASTAGGIYLSLNNGSTWTKKVQPSTVGAGFGALAYDTVANSVYTISDGGYDDPGFLAINNASNASNFGTSWTYPATPEPKIFRAEDLASDPGTGDLYYATKGLGLWVLRH